MANALMAMNPLKISVTANTPKLFTKSIQPLNHHRPSLVVRAQNKQSLNTVEQNTWNDRMKKIQQIALVGGMNALAVLPAMAFEKAALFDFNLTLPIIAAEFLLLMVALDKIWFTPLGKFMDERDEMIRKKLMSVRDNSEEIKKLQEEGEAMLQAARAEVAAALNKMKKETSEELEKKLMESREKVEKELTVALQKLEQQKQETLQSLDKQIEIVSAQIVKKVLPEAVKSKIKV